LTDLLCPCCLVPYTCWFDVLVHKPDCGPHTSEISSYHWFQRQILRERVVLSEVLF
jgi:hypothetical protein